MVPFVVFIHLRSASACVAVEATLWWLLIMAWIVFAKDGTTEIAGYQDNSKVK